MKQQPKIKIPEFLWQLFEGLRRRGFLLTPDDLKALQQSLQAAFGWSSQESLRELCNSLWAKSRQEKKIFTALFNQLALKEDEPWQLFSVPAEQGSDTHSSNQLEQQKPLDKPQFQDVTKSPILPPISLKDVEISERQFIFVPQFPLNYREVAQTWRRLHRPVWEGPPTELDVEATITRRSQLGVAVPVIMRSRRRKVARLLLLVDRQGSMTPWYEIIREEEVCSLSQPSPHTRLMTYAVGRSHTANCKVL